MINEVILDRELLLKTIDKGDIANRIISHLGNIEVMFMYLGGSVAYGTFVSGKSDYDVNCFASNVQGAFKIDIDGIDLFVYGKDVMMDRLKGQGNISLYKKCFIDDVLSLPNSLIYLNENYRKEFEDYKNFDLSRALKCFLTNFYEYFSFCFYGTSSVSKKFYHVIRMRGQMENYIKSGVFTLDMPAEYRSQMLDFKAGYEDKAKNKSYVKIIEKHLEEIYEFKEGLKDG